MRFALLASSLTAAAMWFVLGGAPAQSQTAAKPATCETCGAGSNCPHCAKGIDCPHCKDGKACPHCKGHSCYRAHKFEYKCVHQSEREDKKAAAAMTSEFNALGADGWRLAKADDGFWCFSRIRASE